MPRVRKAVQAAPSVVWKIALYIRLSREDWREDDKSGRNGARKESSQDAPNASRSIVEQKLMLQEYVEAHFAAEEYVVVDAYMDDGLTGTDDTRDDFVRMMFDVDAGNINCIIVKTLSRAFRNYADQGRYLEQVFPSKNVRFISIGNPFVDSFKYPDAIQNGMEIPINGLMNDRFAAKTSADVRRTFDAKRRRGEFIGAFAPYGYIKNPKNKNSLLVDEEAAQVVRGIFTWFVHDGMSKAGIAKKLNELGIPNPSAYKSRVQQVKYRNPKSAVNDGQWVGGIILKILKNAMYVGSMVQGRSRIISYKVHTQVSVPESEWYVVPNTHEAIIDMDTFEKAQSLHARDTRTAPDKKEVYLFSGFIRCADCKKLMRRRTSKELVYYYCRTQTDKGSCTKRSIREEILIQAVLDAIRMQISLVDSLADMLDTINQNSNVEKRSTRLIAMLKLREDELRKILIASESLYLDWKSGDISKDDHRRMKASFDEKAYRLKEAILSIKDEIAAMEKDVNSNDTYLSMLKQRQNIEKLNRGIVVALIDSIRVHEDGQLTIDFAFADEFKRVADYAEDNRKELTLVKSGVFL